MRWVGFLASLYSHRVTHRSLCFSAPHPAPKTAWMGWEVATVGSPWDLSAAGVVWTMWEGDK